MALFWKGSPQIIKTLSWPPDQTQPLLPVLQALRGRFVAWLGPACLPSPSPPHFSLVMCSSHDFFLLVLMSHVLSSGFKKKKKFFSVLFFQPVQFFSSPSAWLFSTHSVDLSSHVTYLGKLSLTTGRVRLSSFTFPLRASVELTACPSPPSTARLLVLWVASVFTVYLQHLVECLAHYKCSLMYAEWADE